MRRRIAAGSALSAVTLSILIDPACDHRTALPAGGWSICPRPKDRTMATVSLASSSRLKSERGTPEAGRITESDIANDRSRRAAVLARIQAGQVARLRASDSSSSSLAAPAPRSKSPYTPSSRQRNPASPPVIQGGDRTAADFAGRNANRTAPHDQSDRAEDESKMMYRCHKRAQKNAPFGGIENGLPCTAEAGFSRAS
jgi:hypothetical protein